MKKTSKVGIALVICGLLSTVGAAFIYAFQQTKEIAVTGNSALLFKTYQVTTNPYRNYTFPLILLTIGFFALGFMLIKYRPQK
jgi:hypothetical protein